MVSIVQIGDLCAGCGVVLETLLFCSAIFLLNRASSIKSSSLASNVGKSAAKLGLSLEEYSANACWVSLFCIGDDIVLLPDGDRCIEAIV